MKRTMFVASIAGAVLLGLTTGQAAHARREKGQQPGEQANRADCRSFSSDLSWKPPY
ncbi:MAG: hypothetical protein ABSG68_17555 [Thermoguttaceae bacterium]|jgi:hypothetical protein